MEDWKEYKIKELLSIPIRNGLTKPSAIRGIGVRMIGMKEIFAMDIIKSVEMERVPVSEKELKLTEILPNDLLFARQSLTLEGAGKCSIVSEVSESTVFESHLIRMRVDDSKANPYYIYYYFKSTFGRFQIQSLVQQVAAAGIRGKELIELNIKIPKLLSQDKIVDVLKSLDDKIELNRKINANLEAQAQALFKSWLNRCTEEVSIGDLSQNITDYSKCNCERVVLINSSDVTEGLFEHHVLSENRNLKGHFKKRFQKGDILYSQVRPRNRHWGYCTFDADNYLASTQLMVIRNKSDILPSILLYQYMIDDKVWKEFTLKTETRSGTFPQGNYDDLSSIRVPFGTDVKEISDKLETIYSMIYTNEQESRRLASLRDTLLPRLMSGELKVNEVI